MVEINEDEKILKPFKFNPTNSEGRVIMFLIKHLLADTPQELIRKILAQEYKTQIEDARRYGKSGRLERKATKAESESEHIEAMKALGDEELTSHLIEIGYNEPDRLIDENSMDGRIQSFRIVTNDDGSRSLWLFHLEEGKKEPVYSRETFTWRELINDMQKQRKL